MLDAMMSAAVGDDVFNEDPTVIELEQYAAGLFRKEAAVFTPSGTMANQVAIATHTQPGDELICDANAHVYLYEGGGMTANAGVSPNLVHAERGIIKAGEIEHLIRVNDVHFPHTSLVCLENTANKGGGTTYSKEGIQAVREVTQSNNLKLHMDGARFFNAHIVEGYAPSEIGPLVDSISICLSKGLGAPVGSLLIGSHEFVDQARRVRKRFGGGMRQAGYLAAAGLYALNNHIERLSEDHARAKRIANGIESLPKVGHVYDPRTNILVVDLMPGSRDTVIGQLKERGLLVVPFGAETIRMVTHLDINDSDVDRSLEILTEVLS